MKPAPSPPRTASSPAFSTLLQPFPFPQHLQAYANLAVILIIQGRSAEANELLEQMARSNPHRGAFLLAAKTLDAFEDRQGAARWRQRAARQDDSTR